MGKNKTRGVIEQLKKLYDELHIIQTDTKTLVDVAKKNGGNLVMLKRKNGEEVEVSEQLLWDEIRLLGDKTEAFGVLQKKYPEAFAKSGEAVDKIKEIDLFASKTFGIGSATKVSLLDIVKICEFLLDEKNG